MNNTRSFPSFSLSISLHVCVCVPNFLHETTGTKQIFFSIVQLIAFYNMEMEFQPGKKKKKQ